MIRLFFTMLSIFCAVSPCFAQTPDWQPNNTVYSILPDGEGGVFVGGDFTVMGGLGREQNRLTRIDVNGVLYPWYPHVNGRVRSISISGGKLYIGGEFTTVNGMPRRHLASFNLSDGTLTDWAPEVIKAGASNNLRVYAILATANKLYVGGDFSQIDGQSRNNLAAYDITGTLPQLTNWTPDPGAVVTALASSSDKLYVGGSFLQIAGENRRFVASFDISGSLPAITGWALSNINGLVESLGVVDETLYVSGLFSQVNSLSRNRLAAFNISGNSPALMAWAPNPNERVYGFAQMGNRLYLGGFFTQIAGQNRNRLASFDLNTGNLVPDWSPNANNYVLALAVSGSRLFGGGGFTQVFGEARPYLFGFANEVLPVRFGEVQATIEAGNLSLRWSSLAERGNSYFEVETSANGKDFYKVGTVVSKAPGGRSDTELQYSFNVLLATTPFAGVTGLLPLLTLLTFFKRKRYRFVLLLAAALPLLISSCRKHSFEKAGAGPKIYVRITQVNIEGHKTYSRVVSVIYQ